MEILNLRNGCVYIKYGLYYAYMYSLYDKKQILDDITCVESWENNDFELWLKCYDRDTTDSMTLYELMKELRCYKEVDFAIRYEFDNAVEQVYYWKSGQYYYKQSEFKNKARRISEREYITAYEVFHNL